MSKRYSKTNPEFGYYKVVRFYKSGASTRTIIARCTLAEAKGHCANPETSSSTATSSAARAVTRRMGEWFEGFTSVGNVSRYEDEDGNELPEVV